LIAAAIEPLIQTLRDRDASMRVLAIYASRSVHTAIAKLQSETPHSFSDGRLR